MSIEVHLDDALYGCCGPDLVVGHAISWPLNFQLSDDEDALTLTGLVDRPGHGPTHSGSGLRFQVGSAQFFLADEVMPCGEVTLTGWPLYIDHGYTPENWPSTAGIVQRIRSADGGFHHRWTRSDSQRVLFTQLEDQWTTATTTVTLELPD